MTDLLRALANPTNQAILGLLRTEPSYARKVAAILDLKESEVTRRLRQMEQVGLVSSAWTYIGKNVKMYTLDAREIHVAFEAGGIRVDAGGGERRRTHILHHTPSRVPPTAGFCGRRAELAGLADRTGVSIIAGMAGIGKTALAAHHAARLDAPVFWHSFRGVESLHWLANRIGVFAAAHGEGRLLEAVQQDLEISEQRALLLSTLDAVGMVFVFDDVHHIEDPHVQSFLDDAIQYVHAGRLICTTRSRLQAARGRAHVHRITLEGLDDDAVQALLERDGVDDAAALLERLRPWLGGHPLGLHLLSATARQTGASVAEVLDRAEAGKATDLHDYLLTELDAGLGDAQRRVLGAACIFRAGFTTPDLQAVATKRIHEKDVRSLVSCFLIADRGDGYALHSIIQSFYRRLLDDARPLHARAAAHFLDAGHAAARIEAMHHLIEAGARSQVLRLIGENLDVREFDFIDGGYARLYLGLLDMFSQDEVEPGRWAVILDEKGDVHFSRGAYEEALAYYEDAHVHTGDDPHTRADLAWKRALAHHRLGDPAAAHALVEAALGGDVPEGRTRDRLLRLRAELDQSQPMR